MATFKQRLVSRKEILLVLAAGAFPIYSWAIVLFFERLTGWLYYLNIWEILSIFAYTQLFAFVESLAVVTGIVLLALVLPSRLFRETFVPTGTAIVLLTALWAMVAQFNDSTLRELPMRMLAVWFMLYLATIVVAWFLLYRSPRLRRAVQTLAERMSVLLYLYIPLSALSLLVILWRNL